MPFALLDFLEGCDWYFGAYARNLLLPTANLKAAALGEVVDRVPEVSDADTVDVRRGSVQEESQAGEDQEAQRREVCGEGYGED